MTASRPTTLIACLAVFLAGCASGPSPPLPEASPVVYPKVTGANPLRQPEYPQESRARKEQGLVGVDVLVDAHGKVKDARILMSSGFRLLDASTLKEAYTWQFVPGKIHGKPAELWSSYFITFALPGGGPMPDQTQAMAEATAKIKQRGAEVRAAAEATAP